MIRTMIHSIVPGILLATFVGCGGGYTPIAVPDSVKSRAAQQVREGLIEFRDGEHSAAGDRFEAALLLEPDLAEAHYNWAVVLDRQGKHAEAAKHLKAAASLAPNNPAIINSEFYRQYLSGKMK
jgi:Flp pilus assembly protein TadD